MPFKRGQSGNPAGRPKGAASQKTREIADKAALEGITPLEVMLQTMRDAWDGGSKELACQIAKDAAPYMHPRLTAVDAEVNANVNGNYQPIPVAERDPIPMDAAAGAASGGDPEALG